MIYKLLVSHVKKDESLALYVVETINGYSFEFGNETVTVKTVYMEDEQNGCAGDFIVWSENAVKDSDGILAIISQNTLEQTVTTDGNYVNKKIVYDEISLAKDLFKDVLIAKDENAASLEAFRILRLFHGNYSRNHKKKRQTSRYKKIRRRTSHRIRRQN